MFKRTLKLPVILSWAVLALLAIMPVWLFIAVWLGSLTDSYEIIRAVPSLMILIIAVASFGFAIIKRKNILTSFLKDKINIMILLFGLIIISLIWLGDATWRAKLAGVAMDSRFLLAFLSARLLALLEPQLWRSILKSLPKYLMIIGAILASLGLMQVLFLPKEFLTAFGYSLDGIAPYVSIDHGNTLRAFATMAGPNNYANYLLITLIATVFLICRSKSKVRLLYFLAALLIAAGLIASSSRAAWIAAIVALVTYLALSFKFSRRSIAILAGSVVFLAGLGTLLLQIPAFRENVLHIRSDRDTSVVTSNDAHVDALADGVNQVVEEPLGCGTGCAGPASYYSIEAIISENYYLQIAQEYGILGGLLFIAIFVSILLRLKKQGNTNDFAIVWLAAGLGLAVAALFAHTFADEAVAISWFTIAGSLIGIGKSSSVKKY